MFSCSHLYECLVDMNMSWWFSDVSINVNGRKNCAKEWAPESVGLWTSVTATLVALLTPILPWRTPSLSHCHLSPQRNVFKNLVVFTVIDTCPCILSLHWIFSVAQDPKGQFQYHTECLKHSLCYSRCSPWHKIFSFSYPTIFHLRSCYTLNSLTILVDF